MADRIKKEEFKENSRGKKPNQKLKPYLVLKFLEKYSDEEHTLNGEAIANFIFNRATAYFNLFGKHKAINKNYSLAKFSKFCINS